jgi:hypothetical protein
MRWYWMKIALGALLVFGVGFAGYSVVSRMVVNGKDLFDSSNPITIPMALVPFSLDGTEVGTFQRITIRRESPKMPSGFDIRVKLASDMDAVELENCRLTLADVHDFNVDEGFHCLGADADIADLIPFGEVEFRGADGLRLMVPLLLHQGVIDEMRNNESSISNTRGRLVTVRVNRAVSRADRAAARARARADSISAEIDLKVAESLKDPPPPQ